MTSVPLFIPNDINKYFYNRKKDIEILNYYINALYENISHQLVLTGYKGVGKTFLLHKLINNLNEDILVSYLDIHKVYSENNGNLTEKSIFINLLNAMNQTIKNKEILNLKTVDSNVKLSDFVMNFPQKIIDNAEYKGFVIIIDEFQLIASLENPEAFFSLFGTYNRFQTNVAYIFAGSPSKTSNIFQIFNNKKTGSNGLVHVNINPFTKNETKNYFNERFPEIKFTKDGFERFYNYTCGMPGYINSFYNLMSADVTYDSENLKETFLLAMDQILVLCIKVWGSLNSFEKNIIRCLCEDCNLKWDDLVKNTGISKGTLTKYLSSLQNKGMVEYTKPYYSLSDNMLRVWLNHEKEVTGYYP